MDLVSLEHGLSSRGLGELRRIVGGWQSLAVYAARLHGQPVAVKVLDPRLVDRRSLEVRLSALAALRAVDGTVCGLVSVAGQMVSELALDGVDPVYAVAYELAAGDSPDITQRANAGQMGRVLAGLHASLATLQPYDLPALAVFPEDDHGPRQLLHGDFSSKNVRVGSGSWRIFDFDDCGYGRVELDLANALYFVLFDAMTGPGIDGYERFRQRFLGGYGERSGVAASDAVLDELVIRRVQALASWLAHPDTAPAGIRTASDQWRGVLADFVQQYLAPL